MIDGTTSMDRPVSLTPRRSSRRRLWIVLALLTLVMVLLASPIAARWARADRALSRERVRIGKVTRGPFVRDAVVQGKIVAALHPTLFSTSAGIVTLDVRAGASVHRGDRLAQIDSPDLRSRLTQESATLQSLLSALERSKIQSQQANRTREQQSELLDLKRAAATRARERADELRAQGLLGATDHERAKDEERIATLEWNNVQEARRMESESAQFEIRDRAQQVERQRSVVAELQRQADALSIRAPFDGSIANIAVQDRDAVAINQPLLTIVDLGQYEVEVKLLENDAVEAAPGTKATIDYEGQPLAGHLSTISPEVRDNQVTATVVFDSALPAGLRQNQRVTVRLVFESRDDVLQVPRGPFLDSGDLQVFVVNGDEATRRAVRLGPRSLSAVEVLSGLTVGDQILISDTSEFNAAQQLLLTR